MADPPRFRDVPGETGDDIGVASDRRPISGPPRWAKVSMVIAIVVAVLVVIMLLVGGGHGPNRHTSSDNGPSGRTPPAGVTEAGSWPGNGPG